MYHIGEEQIEEVQKRVSVLHSEVQILQQKLSVFERICKQGVFLPLEEGKAVLDSLKHLLEEQDEILSCCRELGVNPMPITYEELSKQLKVQREQFSQRRGYEDAMAFLRSLQSRQPEQEEALAAHLASLPAWGDPGLTAERRQEILEDCDLLRRGLTETKDQEKFDLMLRIAMRYGPEIAKGVNFGEITAISGGTEGEETPVFTDQPPEPTPIPESALGSEHTSDPKPAPDSEHTPDPEPDSAAKPVLDSESTSDIVPGAEPALTWKDMGIEDPASMVVTVNAALHYVQAEHDKPFGVKVFKRDLSTYDRMEKVIVLQLAKDFTCVTPEMAVAVFDGGAEAYHSACEKLRAAGYLARYELEGIGQYYVLTPKGWKIFTTKDAAEFIRSSRYKGETPTPIKDTGNAALARIMLLRSPGWLRRATGEKLRPQGGSFLKEKSFLFEVQVGKEEAEKRTFCLLGTAGDTPEDFQHLQEILEGLDENVDALVLVGTNLPHAQALAKWARMRFSEQIGSRPVWYMESGAETCYQAEDHGTVDLAAFLSGTDGTSNGEEKQGDDTGVHGNGEVPEGQQGKTVDPKAVSGSADGKPPVIPDPPVIPPIDPPEDYEESDQHSAVIWNMLAQKQFCCAAAYLNALAQNDPEGYQHRCQKLAYALDDPLAMCEYNSAHIFDVYFSESTDTPDAYIIAAALRNYFLNQCGYDYQLASLWDAIAKLPALGENGALNQAVYKIKDFKYKYHRGIDFYADYRQKKREMFERTLANIRAEARTLYENNVLGKVKERAPQRRFLEAKKIIFSPQSDLAECLNVVQKDSRDLLEFIQEFLRSHYIKDDEDIDRGNIDTDKVENILTQAWTEAGNNVRLVKRSSDLMGRLHTNLSMQVRRVVTVLCDYVSTLSTNTLDENDSGLTAYRRIRDPLLLDLEQACTFEAEHPKETSKDQAAQAVLMAVLQELHQRLDGTYEEEANRYFYLPLLQGDQVLLNEDYLPELQDVSGIPELSILVRIQRHCDAPQLSLEERFWQIYRSEHLWGDDYGSARLILQYLQSFPQQVQDPELLGIDPEDLGFADPEAFLSNEQKEFEGYMELAQSYGQFDNSEGDQKEFMNQIVKIWCEQTQETHNFGFFHQILDALRKKIQRDAKVREQDLLSSLEAYKRANADWEEQEPAQAAVKEILARIHVQNYTAAEDLLNRLYSNDVETGGTVDAPDYLREFLKEYDVNFAKAGRAGGNLQANLAREHNKDTRGGNRLIEYWPKGTNTPPTTIKSLLEALDFPVSQVQVAAPIQRRDHYLVTLNREMGDRKIDYKHPVAAFGSEAETDGFRVVNIFGRMDASQLIDMFRSIGTAKNTLILLDCALTLADRRALARQVKTEFYEKTFAVLDRVALVYLSSHYVQTAINRMLMAVVMPFAADKLYQPNSGQDMPPELFIGRKNELDQIKDPYGANIVYGGRQLGKTALLRKAQKDIDHNENGARAIWVDIKYKDYRQAARKISAALYDEGIFKTECITEDWDELARNLKNRLRDTRDPIPYLLLLIDEADAFIDSCEAVKYQPFDALKDVQSVGAGRFKFVVAGLHNLVRFKRDVTLRDNVGLTHLGSLTVTPFKYKEARELLEGPLSYLGFRFPDTPETARLVSTIFTTTNYFPGLLQRYCAKLIESLQYNYGGYDEADTPPYLLNENLIKRVLTNESLQREIRDKFEITIKVDEKDGEKQDNYYYLVALLTAYCSHNTMQQKGVSADDIIRVARDYEIQRLTVLPRDAVEVLMDEMQELNILKRQGNDRYRFARFNFLQMMGSVSEIEDKILAYAADQEA